MYVQQNGISLALDAAKEAIGFTAKGVDVEANIMRDKVKSELFYQSAQLEADTQDFLRTLEQESDYENFAAKTDNFLEKKRNEIQAQATNAYSAKLVDQMLMSNRMQLQNQVKNLSLKMQFDDIKAETNGTLEIYQNTLTGQNGIDNSVNVISSAYASGVMNASEALTSTIKAATEFCYKEKYSALAGEIKNYINGGKTFEDLLKDGTGILGKEYQVKILNASYASNDPEHGVDYAIENGVGFDDISDSIDQGEINKKVKKALESEWDKQLKEFQEGNKNNVLIQFQKEWNTSTSDAFHENLKGKYRDRIAFLRTQNKQWYSEGDYYQLEVKFAPDELKDKKSGSSTKSDFKSDIKLMHDGLVEAVQNGKLSEEWGVSTGYGAEKALERYYKTTAASIGMNPDQIELGWINESAGFFSDLAKAYKNNGSISHWLENYSDWLKDQAKNKPGNFSSNELVAYGNELMLDTLMDIDVSNDENMNNAVERMKTIVKENALEGYILNKEGKENGSAFLQKHTDKDGKVKDVDKVIIDGFWDLQGGNVSKDSKGKSRIVYSDRRGQDVLSVYAQDAIVNCVDPTARGILSETFNVDAENINAYWESDGKSDYTGRRVYRVNGKDYTFSVDKKGRDSYAIIDAKTGETITDSKSIQAKRKAEEKKLSAKDKQEKERISAEKRKAAKENFDAEQERQRILTERALNTNAKDIPEEFRPSNWDIMGVEDRKTILEAVDKAKAKNKK